MKKKTKKIKDTHRQHIKAHKAYLIAAHEAYIQRKAQEAAADRVNEIAASNYAFLAGMMLLVVVLSALGAT